MITPPILDPTSREDLEAELLAAGCTIKGNSCGCPWHQDLHPSASIIQGDDGHWRLFCHVCARRADAIDLACEVGKINRTEWFRIHGDRAAAPRSTPAPRPVVPARQWPDLDVMASDLARSAQGSLEAVYRYARPGQSSDAAAIRIRMPPKAGETKPGKTFRWVHHNGAGWVASAPAKPWCLFNLAEVIRSPSIVVCEGEKASSALIALGIPATTCPCGAGKADNADWSPMQGKRVAVWPDHDEVGAAHARQVVEILTRLPVPPMSLKVIDPSRLSVPMPAKGDAVEFIEAIPGDLTAKREAVLAALRSAEDTGPARELHQLIEDEISGRHTLVAWPWRMLTRQSRSLLPGTVTILCGAPGGAKSWLTLQSLLFWAEEGVPAAALELEENRAWHLKRALAHLEGSTDILDSGWCAEHAEEVRSAYLRHHDALERVGRMLWTEGNITMARCAEWVEERCAAGCRVLVVDPITLADNGAEKPWDADRKFMARAKVAVENVGASLVLVSHPRKAMGQVRPNTTPTMDELAGGATYQRAAASVLWLANLPEAQRVLVTTANNTQETATIHKMVRVMKARNSAGVGSAMGFTFHELRLSEKGQVANG